MTFWLLHQGSKGNAFYSLMLRKPRVTVRMVPADDGSGPTPLFETPDPFLFNFCLFGTERRAKFKLPLGASAEVEMTILQIEEH